MKERVIKIYNNTRKFLKSTRVIKLFLLFNSSITITGLILFPIGSTRTINQKNLEFIYKNSDSSSSYYQKYTEYKFTYNVKQGIGSTNFLNTKINDVKYSVISISSNGSYDISNIDQKIYQRIRINEEYNDLCHDIISYNDYMDTVKASKKYYKYLVKTSNDLSNEDLKRMNDNIKTLNKSIQAYDMMVSGSILFSIFFVITFINIFYLIKLLKIRNGLSKKEDESNLTLEEVKLDKNANNKDSNK